MIKNRKDRWTCTGDGKISHPQTENYEDQCSFSNCTAKRPLKPDNKRWVFGIVAVGACIGIFGIYHLMTPTPIRIVLYGGATAFSPLNSEENKNIIEKAIRGQIPGVKLTYKEPPNETKPGSGSGIKMLIDEQLDFAQSSRPIKDEEIEAAKRRNFTLKQIPVAIDGIAVYVNPNLDISQLTLKQLRDLFTGKVSNWSQIGKANLPVVPVSIDPQGQDKEAADFFRSEVMDGQNFSPNSLDVRDPTHAIRKVSTTPGAIGYSSASVVCNQITIKPIAIARSSEKPFVPPCLNQNVNQNAFSDGSYLITRRLFIVVRQDQSPAEKNGFAYANMLQSNKGQELVEKAGLAPIVGGVAD
jgi:phosphate transport system substrate-binding protein